MTKSEVLKMHWFNELCALVEEAISELTNKHDEQVPMLAKEKLELEQQLQGWSQSLANPKLGINLRLNIEAQFEAALDRIQEIECRLQGHTADAHSFQVLVDPGAIAERLDRLAEVLASQNPSRGNIELAHHIDRIDCHPDGTVVLRTCKLGALGNSAVELLSEPAMVAAASERRVAEKRGPNGRPRRLTRRRTDTGEAPTAEVKERLIWATDPDRFAGLDERWFDEQIFCVPRRMSWAERFAPEVGSLRKKGYTAEKLANHFGKTLPTIRAALKIARQLDPELNNLPRRMPRRKWHEDHALEVAHLAQSMGTRVLARHFDKSDPTILKALAHAKMLAAQGVAPVPVDGPGAAASTEQGQS